MNPSSNLSLRIPATIAWKFRVLPKEQQGDALLVWSDTDQPDKLARQVEVVTGEKIIINQIEAAVLEEELAKVYLKGKESTVKTLNTDSDQFIHEMISEAKELNCSDIHIEKYQDNARIRMRLDGKLVERYELDVSKYHEYINKIKIIANLDIAEKRLPQDGRILIRQQGLKFDIRVSVLPTLFGEKVVLRLLSSDSTHIEIGQLGMTIDQESLFRESIGQPQGMVLISGPTGSGKTTTLYGALKTLNTTASNILTIEDPIEYTIEGVNQVQLHEKIGLDFSKTLRTFLRQDPDIIMVGEIRDVDTAKIAIRAAMTGHLVMSTLHTNSAWGIISRLNEMGIPRYLIADTLNVAVAQRLLRKLCENCKKESQQLEKLPEDLRNLEIDRFFEPMGCGQCYGTGYQGREAIYEMVSIDEEIRKSILNDDDSVASYEKLSDTAIQVFREGRTSLDEIHTYLI